VSGRGGNKISNPTLGTRCNRGRLRAVVDGGGGEGYSLVIRYDVYDMI